jgi:hypothetical protein
VQVELVGITAEELPVVVLAEQEVVQEQDKQTQRRPLLLLLQHLMGAAVEVVVLPLVRPEKMVTLEL